MGNSGGITGGGGGSTVAVDGGYVTSGDVVPQTTATWAALTGGPTFAIDAAVGDYILFEWSALKQPISGLFWDTCVLVSGAPVRYGATGTSTHGVEGDPGLYPDTSTFRPHMDLGIAFTAEAGDISGGQVTIGIAVINSSGGGKLFCGTNYPLRWNLTNFGPQGAAPPMAPLAPFSSGTEVGVPTGTSLTTRTSLGAPSGSGSYTIVHPVSGAHADLSVSVYADFLFTETFTVTTTPAAPILFQNCSWDVDATVWCVEVDQAHGVPDQMQPLVIFDHCTFQGNGDSNAGLAGSFCWLVSCDIQGMTDPSPPAPPSGAADGWDGLAYSVAIASNLIAGTNHNLPDPHSDGAQCTGTGGITLYNNWCSAGTSAGGNSAVRVGTEDGDVAVVQCYYNGFDRGGYSTQFRGDAAGGSHVITGIEFVGNVWQPNAVYGPTDFVNTTVIAWSGNRYEDGTVIPNPSP